MCGKLFEQYEQKKCFYKAGIFVTVLISLFLTFVVSASAAEVYLLGDVDFDGKIAAADARQALRYSVHLDEYNNNQMLVADVDKDGVIKSADARIILRTAVGFDELANATVTLPDEKENSSADDFIYDDFDADDQFDEIPDIFERVIPDEPKIEANEDTFTFIVYGCGHGVGLSQYGAVALADGGFNYTDILAYYYTGTSVIFGEEYPEYTTYASQEIKTEELVARIVAQEMGGITKNENALKAQAVAVFTLLKRNNFDIKNVWDVGYAVSSYDKCSKTLKKAVSEVVGQYIALTDDKNEKPIMASYSAMAAGKSAAAKDIWGSNVSYLTSVGSPFEMQLKNFISTYTLTSEELKELILSYDDTIVLSDNPAEWIKILSHTRSIDKNRGYVTSIKVGDKTLKGYSQFTSGIMSGKLKSSCFTVVYTPVTDKK